MTARVPNGDWWAATGKYRPASQPMALWWCRSSSMRARCGGHPASCARATKHSICAPHRLPNVPPNVPPLELAFCVIQPCSCFRKHTTQRARWAALVQPDRGRAAAVHDRRGLIHRQPPPTTANLETTAMHRHATVNQRHHATVNQRQPKPLKRRPSPSQMLTAPGPWDGHCYTCEVPVAVGETVIVLTPPLHRYWNAY